MMAVPRAAPTDPSPRAGSPALSVAPPHLGLRRSAVDGATDTSACPPPGSTLLIVEDSPAEAALAHATLRRRLIADHLTVASTVAEALSVLHAEHVSCVLLDLGLPDADGLSALHDLRRSFDVPIVVLTGRDDEDLAVLALAAGAQDYLVKGRADGELLVRTIRYAIERHRTELRARAGHELAQAVLDAMDAHTAVIDRSGTIISTNAAWTSFAAQNGGAEDACGVGSPYLAVCRRAGDTAITEGIQSVLAGGGSFRSEYPCHSNDVQRWFEMRVTPLELSTGSGAVITHTLVTEFKQVQEELAELATHDPLTGLVNRTVAIDAIGDALATARAGHSMAAVVFVDLDRFKSVNDSLGHPVGDMLLREAAHRLQSCARTADTVARFGGDEFVLVCADLGGDADALTAAERFREQLSKPYLCDGHSITLGASIGITFIRDGFEDPQDLIDDADTAMYQAKEAGRDRVHIYDSGLRQQARERFDRAAALRNALRSNEIEVYYQPVVELASETIIAVEALARWQLAGPAEFVPLAEQCGLISDLDRFVLRTACTDAAGWIRDNGYAGTVSVNLSASLLRDEALADIVTTILEHTVLPPQRLVLEVTETAILTEPDVAARTLNRLRALGVAIAVDDFGTGHSSLTNLKLMPVDELKIDRSFISGLGTDTVDTAIVQSVIQLGTALGLQVVAEGVEDDVQRRALMRFKCPLGQGFLWSPAVPSDAIARQLHAEASTPN